MPLIYLEGILVLLYMRLTYVIRGPML